MSAQIEVAGIRTIRAAGAHKKAPSRRAAWREGEKARFRVPFTTFATFAPARRSSARAYSMRKSVTISRARPVA
jgi:hypothetical protein